MEKAIYLADFAHLLDVGVAVNLAYSILEQVHSASQRIYSRKMDILIKDCEALSENRSHIDHLKYFYGAKFGQCKTKSENTVFWFRIIALISGVLLSALLAFLGFFPRYEVSFSEGVIIVMLSLIPVPLGSVVSYIKWKSWTSNLGDDFEVHKNELTQQTNKAMDNIEAVRQE